MLLMPPICCCCFPAKDCWEAYRVPGLPPAALLGVDLKAAAVGEITLEPPPIPIPIPMDPMLPLPGPAMLWWLVGDGCPLPLPRKAKGLWMSSVSMPQMSPWELIGETSRLV